MTKEFDSFAEIEEAILGQGAKSPEAQAVSNLSPRAALMRHLHETMQSMRGQEAYYRAQGDALEKLRNHIDNAPDDDPVFQGLARIMVNK